LVGESAISGEPDRPLLALLLFLFTAGPLAFAFTRSIDGSIGR
jgi:hypothetical protein